MPAPSLPIASLSSVARAWNGVFLLLVECPFCPKTHTHGGGADPANVAAYPYDRSAHCAKTPTPTPAMSLPIPTAYSPPRSPAFRIGRAADRGRL